MTKNKRPSQSIPVARPTLDEEIEDTACDENEKDDVMPIAATANILVNAPIEEVSVITEDDV